MQHFLQDFVGILGADSKLHIEIFSLQYKKLLK